MRQRVFHRIACALALFGAVGVAQGQSAFPNKTINFIVPFAAGGGGDVVARIIAKGLSDRIGQSVVVENRVGAGGNIGSAAVMRSRPDGYTLLNLSSTYGIQAAVGKPGFDAIGDMQPIIMVTRDPVVLVVGAGAPWRDLRELIAASRAKPGALTYGTAGAGSIAHLASEDMAHVLGVQWLHIPYKGSSQVFTDVVSGTVSMMATSTAFAAGQIKGGKARALGIVGAARVPSLPNVPTFAEQGFGDFRVYDWKAIAGPRGIPADVVAFLNREINEVMKQPAVAERLEGDGAQMVGGAPEVLSQTIRADIERWNSLIKRTGMKVE